MAYHHSRLQSLRRWTLVWGYRYCLLGKALCVVQQILVYILLRFQL